ncbi:MAG: hypothetical protein KAS32_21015 [Candidatus Peribacteraceae bacterium]|nr:hypothetical protein [Candidatus Peribacteraceae bacterium]
MLKYVVRLLVKINPLYFLIASVGEMGWGISVEENDELVEGLVIGIDAYLDRHIPEEEDAVKQRH